VIGVSSSGNVRSYQVQWAPAWVSGFHLVGCEHLINDFLHKQHLNDNAVGKQSSPLTTVTSTNTSTNTASHASLFGESILQASPLEPGSTEPCNERENEVETYDGVNDIDGYESDTADLTSCEGTDGDAERSIKEPDLRSHDHINVKEEDGVLMCSNEQPEVYKHLDRVHSPESFRLNNVSYLAQATIQDGGDMDDTIDAISPNELSPSSSHHSQPSNLPRQHRHQQQHPHTLQQRHRTSMVQFHSHHKPRHITTVTKERPKPFVCEHCDRGFSQRHHLKEHVRTHTGVKPFTCEVCSKTFAQRGTLNRHIQTHVKAAMVD